MLLKKDDARYSVVGSLVCTPGTTQTSPGLVSTTISRMSGVSGRKVGLVAALTAALGVITYIVLRRKGQNDEKSKKETKEVKIEENYNNCKEEITDSERKTVTENIIETHESPDSKYEVEITKDTREISHSEDAVKVHQDQDSLPGSEISDMSSKTESLMEWIDRQLREAEMKTSGQWPNIDTENEKVDQIVTGKSTNVETNLYERNTIETDALTEGTQGELEGSTENVDEEENIEIINMTKMQTEVKSENGTEAVESDKNTINAEDEIEEISFKDKINEEDSMTLNIPDEKPKMQANTAEEKVSTNPDKVDSAADIAELQHSASATERLELMTWDLNGNISDTEIELLMEEPSQTHSKASKLLEDSESESDDNSTEMITAGHCNKESEGNCVNIHTEKDTIILRPAWQKKVS